MTVLNIIQAIIGFIGLVCIAIPFSNNKSSINFKHIFVAIILQILLAFALVKIPFIVQIFSYLSDGVSALQTATQEGAEFVFGYLSNNSMSPFEDSGTGNSMIFAFQSVCPCYAGVTPLKLVRLGLGQGFAQGV